MVSILKYGSRKEKMQNLLKRLNKSSDKGIDTTKFSGKIHLKEDPLLVQKKLRDEWK
jgi:hypothetical protein